MVFQTMIISERAFFVMAMTKARAMAMAMAKAMALVYLPLRAIVKVIAESITKSVMALQ